MRPTMRDEIEHSFRRHARRIAIEVDDRQITYAELDRWSLAVAGQLFSAGVRAGDVVAIFTATSAEFLCVDVAIARMGAVKLPINAMLPDHTISYILHAGGTKALVSGVSVAARAATVAADLPAIAQLQASDGPGAPTPGLTQLVAIPPAEVPAPEFDRPTVSTSSPAAIYFTGGTTGRPKGVLHTQSSTVALHYAQMLEAEIATEDRLLLMTPLAHAAGLFAQTALIRGATCVLTAGFDAHRAVQMLIDARITWTFLVPTMIYRVLDVIAEQAAALKLDLRTVVYGAAPITPSRLEQALNMLGPVFIQLYGQTESPNWGTRLSKSDHDLARPQLLSSCGQASIAADVMIVDDHDNSVPAGQTGEICLRTPYLLTEYLGDPAATAQKFLGDWIRTGDIGVFDDQGYLYLRDRKNDMVISGGMNVYCREVEDVLAAHPDVRAVAVVGVPHEDWGEAVHAVVVAGNNLTGDQLMVWSRDRLAAYSRPKSIELVETLPETPFGKVDKKVLREPFWAGHQRGIG